MLADPKATEVQSREEGVAIFHGVGPWGWRNMNGAKVGFHWEGELGTETWQTDKRCKDVLGLTAAEAKTQRHGHVWQEHT